MKKYIILMLIFCLLYNLSGCNMIPGSDDNDNTSPSGPSTSPSTQPSTSPSVGGSAYQAPMVAVSVPVITTPTLAQDGTVVFNHTYQDMSLILPDGDVAQKVIEDFSNRIYSANRTASNLKTSALANYNSTGNWNPYICLTAYDPIRIDQGVLSLFGSHAEYSGTMHPETDYISVNYNLVTGEVLDLNDVLTNSNVADTLYTHVINSLEKQSTDKSLKRNFKELVKPYFDVNLGKNEDWYFSQTGLCFFFQPYEIAPYASGVITAEVPYTVLAGILEDAYFPAEQDIATGTVSVTDLATADQGRFTKYTELILDENGENVLLYTNTAVQNVRIEAGEWSASGAYYTAQHTIFAASSLTTTDAIMIEAVLESALPQLRISYQSAAETVSYYIAKGANGQLQLIP